MLSELQMPDLSAKRHYDGGAALTHLSISTSRSVLLASVGEKIYAEMIKTTHTKYP